MPRRIFRRYLPDPRTLQKRGTLGFLGNLVHEPDLWHLNRRSFAGAIAVGLFMAFMPVPGQMLLAALAALGLRVNLALSVVTVWVSNPITIPPLFYLCYKIGTLLLGHPEQSVTFEMSVGWFTGKFLSIWQPLMLGSFIMACASAVLGYFFAHGVWRLLVIYLWNLRKQRKRPAPKD